MRFNLVGRERDGILVEGSDEHHMYRKWVVDNFLALRECGTDELIVEDILEADETFAGDRYQLMPDLIIRWKHRRRATRIYSDELGEIAAEPDTGRTGEHQTKGFALVLDQNHGVDGLPTLSHNTHFPEFVRSLLNCAETG